MNLLIALSSLILTGLLSAQTVSLVKESKFFDVFKIEEAGILIKLPKNWSLGSATYSKKQSDEHELKKIMSQRYFNGQEIPPEYKMSMSLGPYLKEGKIKLSTHIPTERINLNPEPDFYNDFSVGSIEIEYLETGDSSEQLAKKYHSTEAQKMLTPQDTISPKVIETKINGIQAHVVTINKSLYPKSASFTLKLKYFLQLEDGVLIIDSGAYEASTEKVTTEEGKIINRISKVNK